MSMKHRIRIENSTISYSILSSNEMGDSMIPIASIYDGCFSPFFFFNLRSIYSADWPQGGGISGRRLSVIWNSEFDFTFG